MKAAILQVAILAVIADATDADDKSESCLNVVFLDWADAPGVTGIEAVTIIAQNVVFVFT